MEFSWGDLIKLLFLINEPFVILNNINTKFDTLLNYRSNHNNSPSQTQFILIINFVIKSYSSNLKALTTTESLPNS